MANSRETLDASPTSSQNSPETEYSKSSHFLTVDETKRPRANSDPVGLHLAIANLPQITVTQEDGQDYDSRVDSEVENFLGPPIQRQRSNTCPEDLFKFRRGRPPTPPPTDIMKSPGGKKRSCFNFNVKDLNGISFTHHRLCKVSEDGGELVTKSNQNIRPSHAARRASCLAALSETTTAAEEQKEEEDIPSIRLIQPSYSESSGIAAAIPASQNADTTIDKDFQRIDLSAKKSNIRSEGIDLKMSIAPPNIVNSRYSKENGRDGGDKPSLEAY